MLVGCLIYSEKFSPSPSFNPETAGEADTKKESGELWMLNTNMGNNHGRKIEVTTAGRDRRNINWNSITFCVSLVWGQHFYHSQCSHIDRNEKKMVRTTID